MPRLFTALEIPDHVATQISLLQGGLPGARWIERENLHLTLRFVGDVENPVARELADALHQVKASEFGLTLRDLDVFGGKKPHSLFAGVERSENLNALRFEHERISQKIGLEPEGRKFKPHVTIARVRGATTQAIARYLSAHGGFQSPEFNISRFVLLSSRESVGGGPYVVEESYELAERTLAHAG